MLRPIKLYQPGVGQFSEHPLGRPVADPEFLLDCPAGQLAVGRQSAHDPPLLVVEPQRGRDPGLLLSLPALTARLAGQRPDLVVLVDRWDEKRTLATRGEDGLLRASVDRLLALIGPASDPSDMLDIRDIAEFRDSIAAKPSTEENYLRPRLELLVDLGLVGRGESETRNKNTFAWIATPVTRKLAGEWTKLTGKANGIPDYLENQFFESMARICDMEVRKVRDPRRVLLWVDTAFQQVGREFGFTPGRTLAVLACLLAFEVGQIMEVEQVFDVVYGAARSEWTDYLRFSGGSRFDREFMIRITPGLAEALRSSLEHKQED
jgi:hypothetical protein